MALIMTRRAARASLLALRRSGRALIDLAAPPACPITETLVDAPGRISPQAWAALTFITKPYCRTCGLPFAYDPGVASQCGPCAAEAPLFERARAALAYDEHSRPLVLDFKHGGRTDMAATFAGWMAQAGGELVEEADAFLPVPLHPERLAARRFNQAGLLAQALCKRAAGRFDPDSLRRTRATPSQGGLSADGRRRNVAGAFAMRDGARAAVAGKRLVLVDDVYTTGATLSACARVLKRAGAARVDAVALCRVVRPRDGLI